MDEPLGLQLQLFPKRPQYVWKLLWAGDQRRYRQPTRARRNLAWAL
ncbi:hypothetical protein [Mumia zhuanghuii]|nr:hypothetical protein [Mumia zhuanghuii]